MAVDTTPESSFSLLFSIARANAELLRWNLQNLAFNDGGRASGFFSLDTTQTGGSLADFDIKVTGGKYPSFEYTPRPGIAGSWGPVGFGGQGSVGASFSTTSGPERTLQLAPTLTQPGTYPLKTLKDPSYDPYVMSFEVLGNFLNPNPDLAPRWLRTGSLTTGTPQPPSHGTLVRWTLDGVKFDEGATATGSFIYDASTGTVLDFNVQLNGPLNGFPYGIGTVTQRYPCQPNNVAFANGPRCWVGYGRVELGLIVF